MSVFAAPIAEQIWDMKYRLKAPDGSAIDATIEDSWTRVARALAAPEVEPAAWEPVFYEALQGFRFLPAGRIMAGAGAARDVTLFNCFVMGAIPDTMAGIFDALKEAALTMQQGGGIGYDFSTLRPKGAPVKGVGADASGPLSFMDVWDSMCRTIMSAGSRRGAMMAVMRCDHPDIEAFVDAKRDAARLRMFNLSVLASDAFMEAVKADGPWELQFGGKVSRTVPARDLWNRIMRATYDVAEPGVIFIDRINRLNPLNYVETISATNPCGEQPLPPYGACLLGSINLATLVRRPFEEDAALDEAALAGLVATAVRMMDNVVDVSRFPLEAQAREAAAKRRIGLGVTGLANALAMTGLRYGSAEAAEATRRWLKLVQREAYLASTRLAKEKGPFPLCDKDAYLATETVAALDADVRAEIAAHGIRNALLTSIAPTGTISLLAGNVSSGIEPVFAHSYTRKVLQPDGGRTEEEVEDYAVRLWREKKGDIPLPDWFVTAQDLSPEDHVRMQAAAQAHVESSISKTINCPADISFEAFKEVYRLAYETGCKGCTTYRPNEVTGSVLSVAQTEETFGDRLKAARENASMTQAELAEEVGVSQGHVSRLEREFKPTNLRLVEQIARKLDADATWLTFGAEPVLRVKSAPEDGSPGASGEVVYMSKPLDRPESLDGETYKLKWPESEHAIYITINDVVIGGRRRPFEVFINSKNMEHFAWTVALTRMISAVFRRGGDVSFVVEELKAVFDPRGGAWMQGRYVPSILAAIGEVIERHLIETGFIAGEGLGLKSDPEAERLAIGAAPAAPAGPACPACGQRGMRMIEGCMTCPACGHSKCG
ncbi:adenosylcobalamin-dependent ribonucleoside-diphosphate reductase [Pikeienuella piscinae]|uniref:Vitamin B12-dependent ribonucleotide reductase n=1 Tax=Pikeienuella piscinae TaxID=2748098 RepID=A0A7L5BZ70_9RHOB|nr:adenosylcobalamin-dependent ribonucleoside-diphosphate reductase [Pikeienuella piscinae]QIE54899.1 adenosylcobalamin-dependent ribonucleoside-diphosphate reductase [Pikeienuella piscinae]